MHILFIYFTFLVLLVAFIHHLLIVKNFRVLGKRERSEQICEANGPLVIDIERRTILALFSGAVPPLALSEASHLVTPVACVPFDRADGSHQRRPEKWALPVPATGSSSTTAAEAVTGLLVRSSDSEQASPSHATPCRAGFILLAACPVLVTFHLTA